MPFQTVSVTSCYSKADFITREMLKAESIHPKLGGSDRGATFQESKRMIYTGQERRWKREEIFITFLLIYKYIYIYLLTRLRCKMSSYLVLLRFISSVF